MREFRVPAGTEKIGDCEYYGADFERIVLPEGVKFIDMSAFSGAKCFEIVLPEGIEEIADYAFAESMLESITFPASLKKLGSAALRNCKKLKSVIFSGDGPSCIESITFQGCTALERVAFGGGLKILGSEFDDGGAFEKCISLKEAILPEGFLFLGGGTFAGCSSLGRIVLPATLKAIGEEALAGTAIEELEVPEGVKEFYGVVPSCAKLGRIVLPASVEALSLKAFGGLPSLKEVVLPARFRKDLGLYFPGDAQERMKIVFI